MFADLISVKILNIACFFKTLNKQFKYNTFIRHAMGQITFGNYTVTTL